MSRALTLSFLIFLILGCSQPSNPGQETPDHKLLREQGYTDIQLNGYVPFKCGDDDNPMMTDAFIAKSITGAQVSGVICGGFMKGKTVRF